MFIVLYALAHKDRSCTSSQSRTSQEITTWLNLVLGFSIRDSGSCPQLPTCLFNGRHPHLSVHENHICCASVAIPLRHWRFFVPSPGFLVQKIVGRPTSAPRSCIWLTKLHLIFLLYSSHRSCAAIIACISKLYIYIYQLYDHLYRRQE